MKITCEVCGAEFIGPDALERYKSHEATHARDARPAIYDEPYVVEYEVLPKDYDDYACCELRNLATGEILCDGEVYAATGNTNVGNLEKLIGKRIRITSRAEIIG